uniref:Ribosomal RNA-processing protein 42 n=1 Tax=Chenopodium quinoa TaxID=63459 RepID=A0A803MHV3_CHEQI
MVRLSFGEKNFIRGGIAQNLRCDGRKRLSYRPIHVDTGAELGRPNLSQPDKGKVSIHIDCSATAAPIFQGKGGEALSTELAADLQCCLLDGKSGAGAGIDLSSLSIVEGKVCWDLYIDGLVVSSDGNMLDTLGAAIKATLSDTGIPKVNVIAADSTSAGDQPEVDVSDEEFLQFNTSAVPVIVTVTKVGKHYIVDATEEEESQMSSAMSVSINRKGLICGLSKRGGAGVDPSIVLDMISVTKHVSENFVNKLDSEIAAAEAPEEES